MKRTIILIPAYNPLSTFLQFVKKLLPLADILIVNDGSDEKHRPLFQQLQQLEGCSVVSNEINLGKGRAIKNGLQHILNRYPVGDGVLTVGAHGQHDIEDIQLLLQQRHVFSDGIILGIRDLDAAYIPAFQQVQNKAAQLLFELLFRKKLLDTQTGLRYLPWKELSWLQHVQGETFNYDTNMLVQAIRRHVPIYEVPIGRAKIRSNSIMRYDEIIDTRTIAAQMWKSFIKNPQ